MCGARDVAADYRDGVGTRYRRFHDHEKRRYRHSREYVCRSGGGDWQSDYENHNPTYPAQYYADHHHHIFGNCAEYDFRGTRPQLPGFGYPPARSYLGRNAQWLRTLLHVPISFNVRLAWSGSDDCRLRPQYFRRRPQGFARPPVAGRYRALWRVSGEVSPKESFMIFNDNSIKRGIICPD